MDPWRRRWPCPHARLELVGLFRRCARRRVSPHASEECEVLQPRFPNRARAHIRAKAMTAHEGHVFQPTRWTLVARATSAADAPAARAALDELCKLYWAPLVSFARRWGLNAADAEDVTQSYFAELLQ